MRHTMHVVHCIVMPTEQCASTYTGTGVVGWGVIIAQHDNMAFPLDWQCTITRYQASALTTTLPVFCAYLVVIFLVLAGHREALPPNGQ